MDARTIDNLEAADSSPETTELIQRWRNIVKPGIYRLTGRKWKKYHEPKFLRIERKKRGAITTNNERTTSGRPETKNWPATK